MTYLIIITNKALIFVSYLLLKTLFEYTGVLLGYKVSLVCSLKPCRSIADNSFMLTIPPK